MRIELPSGKPAWPANVLSREGVPVDVVGRPSMGEGRTPGIVAAGEVLVGLEGASVASEPAGARASATLRFLKAILCWSW
jgi:hypothetical protein